MTKYIDKSAVVAGIRNKVNSYKGGGIISISVLKQHCEDFIDSLDTLETKEVDEEYNGKAMLHVLEKGVKQGRREILNNLWKPADGNNLPEVDREVIVLLSNNKVCYAHRPPESWDGKNIETGETTRHYPKRYDKGGWNIPDVEWWLDCKLPIKKED